jgi:DNA primase
MSAILEFADKLRSQVDIADVVGRYVDLRRMGTNMKGLCPFHNEKTPSFTVSTSKQIFHCFGCNEGGDIIKFVQKVERLEWMDAVRHLSKEFNIPMPELRGSPRESAESRDAKTAALDATRYAMEMFMKHLRQQVAAGHEVRDYLNRRGLDPEVAERFQLGLAPDAWTALMDAAVKAGHSQESLLNAGLIIKHADKNRTYDRFRNRLIFPIHDTHGAPIAFGARIYASDARPDEPKYINSPESLVYHKGQALYALHVAKDTIVKEQQAILMEGYMDVIRAHVHGATNAVASCGTALTEEQARVLKRFCTKVVFVYDGDDAGQKAMLRGTETLLDQGFNVAIVSLPDGHDPDSFLTDKGIEAFNNLVSNAANFFDHFLATALSKFDCRTAEGKVLTVEMLLPLLRRITKSIAKNDYVRRLADRLQVDGNLIHRQLSENNPRSLDRLRESMADSHDSREGVVEKTLLKLMVECPAARLRIREKINPEWLRDSQVRKWFYVCNRMQTDELTWESLMNCEEGSDSEQEQAFLRSLAVLEESCDSTQKTIDHVAVRIHRHYLQEINRTMAREIDEFFQGGLPEDKLLEGLRKVDENTTPVRTLVSGYFLKNTPPQGRH